MLLVAAAAAPAPAAAATFCVGVSAPACQPRSTASAAFAAAAAAPGTDTILLGPLDESEPVADADGEPVHVAGSGRAATTLAGLELAEPESSVGALTVAGPLELAGSGRDLRIQGRVDLRGALLSAAVDGPIVTATGARMESVIVRGDAGVAVESGDLAARHLTVAGFGPAGVHAEPGATAALADSIVWGFAVPVQGAVSATSSLLGGDPGFTAPPTDLSLRADSPLVDAGDPAPLAPHEPQEDALGDVRAVDGNGDGSARRDVGALERRPPLPPPAVGNLLANPGAEEGRAATDDAASFAPPGWTRDGGFTAVRYGTVAGGAPFPTLAASAALGGGRAFFAGGPHGSATLTQVVDVSRHAPEIDGHRGGVRLSALLGGYRESPDRAIVAAEFRGPTGRLRGTLALDGVTPAERANATMLAPRAAAARIPRLTRTIAVTVHTTPPGGRYNDAYADELALVPRYGRVRGVPRLRPPPRRPRAFGGAALLRRRVPVGPRARLRIGCPARTVGRCGGVATVTRGRRIVLGSRRFVVRPGHRRRLAVPVRHRRRGRGHVYLASRDRQGLTRTAVARVRLTRK